MGDVRVPQSWRKPRSRIYDYNRDFGGTYYQPMLNYLDTKERQGVFFEKPTERIHFPDNAELKKKDRDEATNFPAIDTFLVKAYAQQAKEMNVATAHTQAVMLRSSRDPATLSPKLTSAMLRDHYVREIKIMKAGSVNNRR